MSRPFQELKPPEGETQQFCDEYIRCMKEFDFQSLTAHIIGNCSKCTELHLTSMAKEYEGQEMLFTDGRVPSWIKREEIQRREDQKEENQSVTVSKFAAKKELRNKMMGPEEIDAMIWEMNMTKGPSDAAIAYELRKYKHLTEEEARKEVIELRRRKLEIVKEAGEKEGKEPNKKEPRLPRSERSEQHKHLPWAPKLLEYFHQTERSVVTEEEQKRIISILSSYWNESKFRFTQNKEDVKMADQKLKDERDKLNQMICEEANPFAVPGCFSTGPKINTYVSQRCSKRWQAVVGMAFYHKPIEQVDWSSEIPENVPTANPSPLVETIQFGHQTKIRLPSLEDRLEINQHDVQRNRPLTMANRARIEEDTTAFNICLERGITVAMDATTASYLMTESFVARRNRPRYVISVRSQIHEGSMKKVIFISKPLHAGGQTSPSYLRTFTKHGFLGQYLEKTTRQDLYEEEPTTLLRNIVQSVEPSFPPAEEQPKMPEFESKASFSDDPLAQIMTEMGNMEPTPENKKASKTGKRYAIYKIGNQRILIRSTAPLVCQTDKISCLKGKSISLGAVIEWLPNVGAMRLQEEELLFNYCKHIFKDSQAHCLVRFGVSQQMHHKSNWTEINVLQIHALSAFTDPISAEIDQNMKKRFTHRLGRLDQLLNTVATLEDGFFMLTEMAGRMNISKELDKHAKGPVFPIKSPFWIKFEPLNPDNFKDNFEGIDHRAMLQWQIYIHRIPGAFLAADSRVAKAIDAVRAKQPKLSTTNPSKAKKRQLRKKTKKQAEQQAKKNRLARDMDAPSSEADDQEEEEDNEGESNYQFKAVDDEPLMIDEGEE